MQHRKDYHCIYYFVEYIDIDAERYVLIDALMFFPKSPNLRLHEG